MYLHEDEKLSFYFKNVSEDFRQIVTATGKTDNCFYRQSFLLFWTKWKKQIDDHDINAEKNLAKIKPLLVLQIDTKV